MREKVGGAHPTWLFMGLDRDNSIYVLSPIYPTVRSAELISARDNVEVQATAESCEAAYSWSPRTQC